MDLGKDLSAATHWPGHGLLVYTRECSLVLVNPDGSRRKIARTDCAFDWKKCVPIEAPKQSSLKDLILLPYSGLPTLTATSTSIEFAVRDEPNMNMTNIMGRTLIDLGSGATETKISLSFDPCEINRRISFGTPHPQETPSPEAPTKVPLNDPSLGAHPHHKMFEPVPDDSDDPPFLDEFTRSPDGRYALWLHFEGQGDYYWTSALLSDGNSGALYLVVDGEEVEPSIRKVSGAPTFTDEGRWSFAPGGSLFAWLDSHTLLIARLMIDFETMEARPLGGSFRAVLHDAHFQQPPREVEPPGAR